MNLSVLLRELWQSWRASLRRPGFVLLAIGVLALGVAATASVSTLINQVLLQPLPLPQPSRLVVLGSLQGQQVFGVSPRQYQHLGALPGVQSLGLIGMGSTDVNIAGDGSPALVPAIHADRHLLPTLGLHMVLGRNFDAQDDAPHGPKVVILSHGFWLRRYDGSAQVIGREMLVGGVPHAIIGVLPANFDAVGVHGDIVLPAALRPHSNDDSINYTAIARLAAGVSMSTVAAEVNVRMHAMYAAHGETDWLQVPFGANRLTTAERVHRRSVLLLFLTSALFVLLIALVNLANLMVLRALSRTHDAVVRSALGASRLRLVLPALAEAMLVGAGGALLGMLLTVLGMHLLQHFIPASWLAGAQLHIGSAVWALAFVLGIGGAMLAVAIGLWRSHAVTRFDDLREGGRSGIGVRSGRLNRVLVMAQVAMATALLSTAGMLLHTLYDAAHTPLGFSDRGILTVDLAPVPATYPDAASVDALAGRLVQRLRRIPGVQDATATTSLPAGTMSNRFIAGGSYAPGNGRSYNTQYDAVGVGFFRLFDIPVLQGRAFTRDDVRGSENVAIVNQAMARDLYGSDDAVGKRVLQGGGADVWSARIVGVVANTRQYGPLGPSPAVLYVPLAQVPDSMLSSFRSFEPMRLAIRVHGNPYDYRTALRHAVAEVAPQQPIARLQPMSEVVAGTLAPVHLNLLLVGIFSLLALLLAVAGLYAVMAVAVAVRQREFAVRAALGASPPRLIRLVLRGALLQIVIGLAVGIALAFALGRALRAVLQHMEGVSSLDPAAMLGACLLLVLAGLAAALVPALRAARVQPNHAL